MTIMTRMSEARFTPTKIEGEISYADKLNPDLWDQNDDMQLDVRVALLRIAKAFFDFLDTPGLKVEDVIFTGSNAAFTYNENSDLDVHIVVDFQRSTCPELADNFFNAKKALWNDSHEITVRGLDVELYVENTATPVTALGVYSLLRGEWIRKPEPEEEPSIENTSIARKVEDLASRIDHAVKTGSKDDIARLLGKIKKMRQAGLAQGGEFSVENLTFKVLRNHGYLDRLWAARGDAEDKELSLKEGR